MFVLIAWGGSEEPTATLFNSQSGLTDWLTEEYEMQPGDIEALLLDYHVATDGGMLRVQRCNPMEG